MTLRNEIRWGIVALLGLACLGFSSDRVEAYTPESPEVKQIVSKALDYLDNHAEHSRLGGKSLIALAMIKGNMPKDHPRVEAAVKACQQAAKEIREKHTQDVIYDLGIAIIFLCELDPEQYRTEIQTLMQVLMDWQKPFGGWGYLQGSHVKTGDTSMTQYAVLSLWTADRSGAFPVVPDRAAKVTNWLIRTQDVSGGWGYQGKDPGTYQRVSQLDVQHSLSAAGVGSVYVLADLLRLAQSSKVRRNTGLPPALRAIRKENKVPSKGPVTSDVEVDRLKNAMRGGDQWFTTNYQMDAEPWTYYYMYAFERYQSFRELVTGNEEAEPKWYNDGVEHLKSKQSAAGSWDSDGGPTIDTCFGILFLTRGTKKSIQRAEAYNGRLRGGRGLPTNTAKVAIGEDGQIVKTPFQGKAESLLAILEAGGDDELDLASQEIMIQLSRNSAERERQLIRLRRLLTDDDFAVRLAAVKALHSTRDLDNVPALIYALGDPDPRVIRKARDSLRLLSRKISGFGLPDEPSDGAKLDAISRWKDWYLTIRPDAQFMN